LITQLHFMPNRKLSAFLFSLFVMIVVRSTAQQPDSMLHVYRTEYQQEKLHLHFDKQVYSKGETIWFKAYLRAGETPSDYSRNFYVDWYDHKGKLIKHTIHPVFESSARGQFEVPAKYEGRAIYLKAYTRWMMNFDSSFIYNTRLQVAQDDAAPKPAVKQPEVSLRFFPEGGDLIKGISATVAFKAVDQSGMPVAVKGAILNNKNELIDSIVSVHNGMGSFLLEPQANETYSCAWVDEFGITHNTPLPVAKSNGVVLESRLTGNKTIFIVKRSAAVSDNFKLLHIVATINQQMVYNASINLSAKLRAGGEIPTANLQTGILQLTVFDDHWIPVAERIVYVNNNNYQFFPDVYADTKRFTNRSKNTFSIHVPDSVSSNMSVSVTDASFPSDSSSGIIAQLLLSSDLKGYIHQPSYYFSSDNETVRQRLDLLMLTHGWRRIRWEDIVAEKPLQLKYPIDSDYLQIKGKLIMEKNNPIKPNQQLTLIMQSKDSTKQYFMTPIAADGSFNQRGLIFFDTVKVYYQINADKKLSDRLSANIQSGIPLMDIPASLKPIDYTRPDTSGLRAGNLFYTSAATVRSRFDTTVTLKDVVVHSKAKSNVEVLDEKYTTGIFSNRNDYAFDIMNDERAKASINIFYYLQNLIPGLTMSIPMMGANGAEDANSDNVPGLNWREGTPDIFINEMPADALSAMNLSMTDVAYVKVFKPPFMASTGNGASGAIAIYTRKPADRSTDRIKGMNSATLNGYTAYKEFYHPDYTYPVAKKPDTRSTLYWNPYVLTDKKNNTIKINFFNNDLTRKFRIIVEGVNAAGKLARVEKIIEP